MILFFASDWSGHYGSNTDSTEASILGQVDMKIHIIVIILCSVNPFLPTLTKRFCDRQTPIVNLLVKSARQKSYTAHLQ